MAQNLVPEAIFLLWLRKKFNALIFASVAKNANPLKIIHANAAGE